LISQQFLKHPTRCHSFPMAVKRRFMRQSPDAHIHSE
jgi:hypothetical protein